MNDKQPIFELDDQLEIDRSLQIESLQIDAKQGFLLSQIDGNVSVADLKSIVRLPEKEFTNIVSKFIETGVIKIKGKSRSVAARKFVSAPPANGASEEIPIEEKVRRLYLDMDFMNYYQMLQLSKMAKPEDVKNAYYKLSKEYHPDRFFRGDDKEVRSRLQSIFARINEAYKILTDKDARAEYDKQLKDFEIETAKGQSVDKKTGEVRKPPVPPQKIEQKIMAKNPFLDNVLKAKRLYDGALNEIKKKNYSSARQNLKIAANLDPYNKNIPESLRNIEKLEAIEQARQYYESGLKLESEGNAKDAARLYRECMLLDSENPLYYNRLARITLSADNNAELARKLLKKAIELDPKNADHYLLLGATFIASQQPQAALAQFEKGLELEPGNKELQKELKKAKKLLK